MDILCILALMLILLVLAAPAHFKKKRAKAVAKRETTAPEPAGAWPFIGHLHLLSGQLPISRTLGAMADEYGPVFSLRLGTRPSLVVSNWETIKECFTSHDRIFASRPDLAIARYMWLNNANFALAPYGPYWREVRKMVIQELLANHQLEKFKNVRASELDHFIKDLHSLSSKAGVVNLSEWFEHLTFNIILRILVGKRFSSCSDDKDENGEWKVKEAIKKALYLSGVFVVSDVIPFLEWMDIGGHIKAMKKAGKELDQVIQRWLEEHVERRRLGPAECEVDFMDVLLSRIGEEFLQFGHTREAIIKATLSILIFTASESTAVTMIWAVSLLLNNPHVLKAVEEELDVQVGKSRWVEESDLKNLKYLEAVVQETLRLYPPGPLSGPREASEDCYIGNYFVPKGTRLIVNLWKLHRDSRVWSEPSMFKPERFLNLNGNISYKGQSFEYIPFSTGRRMCPAVNYGMQAVQLTLARLIQGFELATTLDKSVDMAEGLGISLPKSKPLEVLLTPRLPLALYQKS